MALYSLQSNIPNYVIVSPTPTQWYQLELKTIQVQLKLTNLEYHRASSFFNFL
jgi:hypothetical protein